MFGYVIAAVLATHTPYHWEMKCSDWVQRKHEIMLDENLSLGPSSISSAI